jgi:hypothetical protein
MQWSLYGFLIILALNSDFHSYAVFENKIILSLIPGRRKSAIALMIDNIAPF